MSNEQRLSAAKTIAPNSNTLSISVAQYLASPEQFSCILDARTPAEFLLDHLPNAINTPVLSNEQRITVGTLDKQISSFEAKKLGASLVASNIGELLKSSLFDQTRHWSPVVYCWRGGNRSASLAHVLRKIGWRSVQLEGGYKAFRSHVITALQTLSNQFHFRVIAGRTGAGKTRLLSALHHQGAQVLDLEALAKHRGSVLGQYVEGSSIVPQPSQKAFETQLWHTLRSFDTNQPVYVESESAKVGNVRVPEMLMHSIRMGQCILLEASLDQRVALLCEEYAHFLAQRTLLTEQLARLTAHYGDTQIQLWQSQANAGQWFDLVSALLLKHYDPAYEKSLSKNYTHIQLAQTLLLPSTDDLGFTQLAQTLIQS